MQDEEGLATFQAALLDALDTCASPEEVIGTLLDREDLAPFRDYIATFETRTVSVAMELVRKWGVRG